MKDILDIIIDVTMWTILWVIALYAVLCATAYTVSADEVLTLDERVVALTILGESRGEGKMGMYAIAALIQERAKQRKLTPAQVCKQHKQFSVWNDKKERDLWHLWKSTSAPYARQLARYVCKGYGFANVTGRADHYYSKKIRSKPPYWAKGRKASATIGNHVFYRLAKN